MDEFGQELTKQMVEQTAGNAYSDLVQPTAKSLGTILNFIPGIIAAYLTKCQNWLINGKKSIELTAQAVQEKIQNIPEEKLTEPEANIAIPAIQQLSYCYDCEELRKMYANLLVTSMNVDTKSSAHPAYVDIIKQLTPDEGKLLRIFPSSINEAFPIINLNSKKKDRDEHNGILKNFSDISYGICTYPDNISAYLENFERLGLISFSTLGRLVDDSLYTKLKQHPYISSILAKPLPDDSCYDFEERYFALTNFGLNFIKACVIEDSTKTVN